MATKFRERDEDEVEVEDQSPDPAGRDEDSDEDEATTKKPVNKKKARPKKRTWKRKLKSVQRRK